MKFLKIKIFVSLLKVIFKAKVYYCFKICMTDVSSNLFVVLCFNCFFGIYLNCSAQEFSLGKRSQPRFFIEDGTELRKAYFSFWMFRMAEEAANLKDEAEARQQEMSR